MESGVGGQRVDVKEEGGVGTMLDSGREKPADCEVPLVIEGGAGREMGEKCELFE